MRRAPRSVGIALLAVLFAAALPASAQSPAESPAFERDSSGNFWVVAADLIGPQALNFRIQKFDAAGVFLSSTPLAGALDEGNYGIDFDSSGNAWVAGTREKGGLAELAVWKIDSGGANFISSAAYAEAFGNAVSGGIAVDVNDAVWIAGAENIPFGGPEDYHFALWKFDSDAVLQAGYPRTNGRSANLDGGFDTAVDAAGNVWSVGLSSDPATAALDMALWKFDPATGNLVSGFPKFWPALLPPHFVLAPNEDLPEPSLAVGDGTVWTLTGKIASGCGQPDFALARFDPNGVQVSSHFWRAAGGLDAAGTGLALDASGGIIAVGDAAGVRALWRYDSNGNLSAGFPRTQTPAFDDGQVAVGAGDVPYVVVASSPAAFLDGSFLPGAEGPNVCGQAGTAFLSGTITYNAGFAQNDQVTIIASTDPFAQTTEFMRAVFADAGQTVGYSLQVEAPGAYLVAAVVGDPDVSPGRPIGTFQNFLRVPVNAGESVEGISFTVSEDLAEPTAAITSIVNNSTLTALSLIEGTVADNSGVDGVGLAFKDLTFGLWWDPPTRQWVSTSTKKFHHANAAFSGSLSAAAWQVDVGSGPNGALGGPAGFLSVGNVYRVRVRTKDFAGNIQSVPGKAAFTWQGPQGDVTPPPPQTISGTAQAVDEILWTWSAVPNADSYTVFSATSGAPLAGVSAPAAQFSQVGLSTNTQTGVCVASVNNFGVGGQNCGPFVYTFAAVPGRPEPSWMLDDQFIVSWDANTNPPGTDYQVEHSSDDFATVNAVQQLSTATALIQGLVPDSTYYVRVAALNHDQLPSAYSAVGSAKTKLARPGPPVNLSALFDLQAQAVNLSWEPAPAGTPAVSYNVLRGLPGLPLDDANFGFAVMETTETAFADQPGQSEAYFYRVEGINADGIVGPYAQTGPVTYDVIPPAAITELAVGAVRLARAEVDLVWSAPTDDFSGPARYIVRSSDVFIYPGGFDTAQEHLNAIVPGPPGTAENLTVTVDTGSSRYFALKVEDGAGNLSPISNIAVADLVPPAIVFTGVAEGAVLSRPRNVSAGAFDDVGIAAFEARLNGVLLASSTNGGLNFFFDTRLFADGPKVLVYTALDAAGNQALRSVGVTINYQPPGAPHIQEPADGFITRVSTIDVAGSAPLYTTLQLLVNGLDITTAAVGPGGQWSILPAALPEEGDITLTAVAFENRGFSPPSTPVAGVFASSAPNAPILLSAASLAGGGIRIEWSEPSGKTPTFYRVYRSLMEEDFPLGGAPPALRLLADNVLAHPDKEPPTQFTDLPPADELYFYAVTSMDGALNESVLSETAHALADRVPPTAAVTIERTPPVGVSSSTVELILSEVLSQAPLLTFNPDPAAALQQPIPLFLEAVTATLWRATLSVTADMPSGTAEFAFQGADLSGNPGTQITAGDALELDTDPPAGTVALSKTSPLSTGTLSFTLTLDEPAAQTPALTLTPEGGAEFPIPLTSGDNIIWTGDAEITPAAGEGEAFIAYGATDALGNFGAGLQGGTTAFVVDTIAPGDPAFVRANAIPGGLVVVSWSAPSGERPTEYRVLRDGVSIATVAPRQDGSGSYIDAPTEGPRAYAVSSIDAAGNESAPTDPPATADGTPPPPPINLSAQLNPFDQIVLDWQAADPADTAGFRLYRATGPITTLAGLQPRSAVVPFTDSPAFDATFHYVVTALDSVGNESGPSNEAQMLFDRAGPVLTVFGAAEGDVVNQDVPITFFAADNNLLPQTVQATLDGQPFTSGSTITAQGLHTFFLSASDSENHASEKTIAFTIDKEDPRIQFAGVTEGQVLQTATAVEITVTDLNPGTTEFLLSNRTLNTSEPYGSGDSITRDGFYVLSATATDLAGNQGSAVLTFRLNAAPIAPTNLTVAVQDGSGGLAKGALINWTKPEPDVIAYRVYRDGRRISSSLHQQTSFHDPAFVDGQAALYEVSAVDATGQEGPRARASVPALAMSLVQRPLTRGFFDAVAIDVANGGAQELIVGPAQVEVLAVGRTVSQGTAPVANLPAAGSARLEGVVSSPPDLPDAVSIQVALTVPTDPGASLSFIRSFPAQAQNPLEPIVEIFPDALVPGAESPVQIRFNNRGSAPLDIVTARIANSTTAAVNDVLIRLRTPEGTLFAQGGIKQTNNTTIGFRDNSQVFFVTIPGNSGVLLEPVRVLVPNTAAQNLQVEAEISTPTHSLPIDPITGSRAFLSTLEQAVVEQPPLRAEAFPERPFYDQRSSVTFVGRTFDTSSGFGVPFTNVSVTITKDGFPRTIGAVTDSTGGFKAAFFPMPSEAGVFNAFAAAPGVVSAAVQSSFTIVGFKFQFTDFTLNMAQNSTVDFTVDLENTGQTPLTGLQAGTAALTAQGVSLVLDPATLPSTLPAGRKATLSLSAQAAPAASSGALKLSITESHGFTRELPVLAIVSPAVVLPKADPRFFQLGVLSGESRTQRITLSNQGFDTWRDVTLTPPALGFARIVGGQTGLGDIPPGGNVSFTLAFAPSLAEPTGLSEPDPLLQVLSLNAPPLPIRAGIAVTSSRKGDLLFSAINADKPRDPQTGQGVPVPGTLVTLTSLDVSGLSFQQAGDLNGVSRFTDIPSGNYAWRAEKEGFQARSGTAIIEPGLENKVRAVMITAVVTYEWSVTPTTIVDKYNIVLNLAFKTGVLAPAIIIDPPTVSLEMDAGQLAYTQYTIKNAGLVRAFDIELAPSSDPDMVIEPAISKIDVLEPGESVSVPVKVTLINASCHGGKVNHSGAYRCSFGTDEDFGAPSFGVTAGRCGGGGTPLIGGGGGSGGGYGTADPVFISAGPAGGSAVSGCGTGGGGGGPKGWGPVQACRPGVGNTGNNSKSAPAAGQGPGSLPLPFAPRYNSLTPKDSLLGFGWSAQFLETATFDEFGNMTFTRENGTVNTLMLVAPPNQFLNGAEEPFSRPVQTNYTGRCGSGGSGGGGAVTTTGEAIVVMLNSAGESLTPQNPNNAVIQDKDGTFTEFAPTDVIVIPAEGSGIEIFTSGGCGGGGGGSFTRNDGSQAKTIVSSGTKYVPVRKMDRNGNIITYAYTQPFGPNTKLAKVTDNHGRFLQFAYDAQGKLASMSDSAGRTTSYDHDAEGNLIGVTDAGGDTTQYGYDANHFLAETTFPNGGKEFFVYDSTGRVLEAKDDLAGTNKAAYEYLDASSATLITDALNRQTRREFIEIDGLKLVTKVVDPLNNTTASEYDTAGNLIKLTSPLNRVTRFKYDDNDNATSITDPLGQTTQIAYEPKFSQPTQVTDPKGNAAKMYYDAKGNLIQIRDPLFNGTLMSYDAQGHVTAVKDALGQVSAFTYNQNGALNSVTDPLGRKTVMQRDAASRVTQNADPKLKVTSFNYDPVGNLTQVTDALGGVTKYEYAPGRNGRLLSKVIDAERQATLQGTTFGYDPIGRLTSVTNALNQTKTFTYDLAGNLKTVTDANGRTITFDYDALDRLLKKTLPATTADPGGDVLYEYDAVSNLTKVSHPNGSIVEMSYDSLNRVTQVIQTLTNGYQATIGYAYDANGNRTQMTTPWGNFSYTYDALNRLTSITNPDNRTFGFEYDALGRRKKLIYPNGIETTYAYDAAGQLTQILHRKTADNTAVAFFDYAYDAAGNRTSMTDMTGTHTYGYDDLHRLTSATHPPGSNVPTKDETFVYDRVGNRLNDTNIKNYVYDAANRLLENSSFTYTHDANGNMTGKTGKQGQGTTTYAYDAENQLARVDLPDATRSAYEYDGLGRRVEKSTGPMASPTITRYIYDNEDILAMLDGSNSLIMLFTHGLLNDEILGARTGGIEYFAHVDVIGSVIAVSNGDGDILEEVEYESYGFPAYKLAGGLITSQASNIGLHVAFSGKEFENEITLYLHGDRYRDPLSSGYLQEERLGLDGTNRYWYALSNPVNLRDPTGLAAEGALIGGITGGLLGGYIGGIGGTIVGGTVGTLALPGGGTIAGGFIGLNIGAVQGAFIGATAGAILGDFLQDNVSFAKGESSDPDVRDASDEEVARRARNRKDPKWDAFKKEAKRRRLRRSSLGRGDKGGDTLRCK